MGGRGTEEFFKSKGGVPKERKIRGKVKNGVAGKIGLGGITRIYATLRRGTEGEIRGRGSYKGEKELCTGGQDLCFIGM